MADKKYIKSPMNYTGGKYKLLHQIEPLFPENINLFVDLFTGGGNIAANVKANKLVSIRRSKNTTMLMNLSDKSKK